MTSDARTIAVYDDAAKRYGRRDGEPWEIAALKRFLDRLSPTSLILDLGCGPGHFSEKMRAAGHRVDPVDASEGMVSVARSRGLPARRAGFDQIDGVAHYEGVWANFSLLHAPRQDVPTHLTRLHTALKPGGVIHIGFKVGSGEGRDSLDRYYTWWEVEEMRSTLTAAGFTVDKDVHRGKSIGLNSSPFGWALMTAIKKD